MTGSEKRRGRSVKTAARSSRGGRFRVLGGNPAWPTGASLDTVLSRGGLRFFSAEELARLEFCRPDVGDVVEVPDGSIAYLLRRGMIEPVMEADSDG